MEPLKNQSLGRDKAKKKNSHVEKCYKRRFESPWGFIERIPSSIDGNQINFFIGFCVTLKHIFALMRQFLASSSIAGFKVLNRQIG